MGMSVASVIAALPRREPGNLTGNYTLSRHYKPETRLASSVCNLLLSCRRLQQAVDSDTDSSGPEDETAAVKSTLSYTDLKAVTDWQPLLPTDIPGA